ncbi:MAG: hypothetical protein OEZ34_13005, partial [Spirochaetia bacterium]|nr:hypothetical protein [Spirochaetia bacterium]
MRLFLTALLITGVCAGTKFQTAEDFEVARNEAASGKDLSKQIYKEYKKIPPEFRLEAVELAASSNSKKAKKYLRKILEKYEEDPPEVKSRIAFHLFRMEDEKSYPLIMNLIRSEKVLVDDSIAEFLVKDKKPENAEILFHALQNEKISYTPELAAFFGMVKYISAIPYLIEALDKKQLPAETIEALSAMKEEGGEAVAEKIFSILSDHSHPYRKHALKNLKGFPEDRVRSVVMDILKHREGESEGVVLLALEVSADLEYEKKLMSQIKETYVYENRAPVKNAALQAAVKVLGVSEEEFLNEIHMPLAEHQSRMAFLHSGGSDEDDTFLLESEMPDITEEGTLTENNEKDKKKEAEIASDQDQAEAADDDESLDVDSLIKEMMEEDENAENIPDASESKMGDASVSECDCKTLEETVDAQKKEIASKKSEIEKLKKKKSYTGKKPAKKAKPKYKKTKPVKK